MSEPAAKTLVTGAGGFIGSHLVEALLAAGANVRCFLRYNSRRDVGMLARVPADAFKKLDVYFGDLTDADAVATAAEGVDTIFHLGALIAIPYSYLHPRSVVAANVLGTLNVLQAARQAGVRRVVHTSTSEVYGTAQTVPIDENHPLNAQSPYAASKIGADQLALSFHRSFELPVVTVRPFNTYGPRQSARAVIPTIIMQALNGKPRIELGSLTPTRDFNYVGDTVAGFMAAADAEGVEGGTFNLGTGKEISIGDLAERIVRLVGCNAEIVTAERRTRPSASEVMRLVCNADRARQRLGWQLKTDLDTGLTQTIDYIRQHLSDYTPDIYVV